MVYNMPGWPYGGGVNTKIEIQRDGITAFCRRHRIRKLAFFGSVLRDDLTPSRDVDVLVEFEPDVRIGLIGFARISDELSQILKRKVDLNTPDCLSRYFRDPELLEDTNNTVEGFDADGRSYLDHHLVARGS